MGGDVLSNALVPDSHSTAAAVVADGMRQMHLRDDEAVEAGQYPERLGEPDCAFYMRSGSCKFGRKCKFNHPPNRNLVVATARLNGEYPERAGQPECQYYLKTGTCKFGVTCKFHHPKNMADVAARVPLNMLGYPLRPNEVECSYYLRTGQCKFGNTCKFHHRQPASLMLSVHGSPIHPSMHSPATAQSYQGGLTNWPITRGTFLPSPRWQGNSSPTQRIFPHGSGHHHAWNEPAGLLPRNPTYVSGPANYQQREKGISGVHGEFSSYNPGSALTGMHHSLQGENLFPQRPGEPDCQFYMKTGDCKFGSVCRFHHPRDRSVSLPDCMLSPLGLPLRPGEPLCVFYSRYAICKFGPNCKFDHPMENSPHIIPALSSADVSCNEDLSPAAGAENINQPPQIYQLGCEDGHNDV